MKNLMQIPVLLSLLICLVGSIGCQSSEYGIFSMDQDQTSIIMNGEIGDNTYKDFMNIINDYPDVKRIVMHEVPGSDNDEVNLRTSKKVIELGLDIHLIDNGLIASGGVDFFLAGRKRSIGSQVKIGVHSWANEDDGVVKAATEFEDSHPEHQPYIEYYQAAGLSQQQATEFYFFTINAAPPEGIHWMSSEEINRYSLINN